MKRALPALLVFFLCVASARAQNEDGGRPAPSQTWRTLPLSRRQAILRSLARYEAMSPEKKALIGKRYARFRALAPARKEILLRRWNEFQALPPEKRKAVRAAIEKRAEDGRRTRERRENRGRPERIDRLERRERRAEPHRASRRR